MEDASNDRLPQQSDSGDDGDEVALTFRLSDKSACGLEGEDGLEDEDACSIDDEQAPLIRSVT